MTPPASRRLEIGLLLALCIFLPLYEAPKNLAWLAYALVVSVLVALAMGYAQLWSGTTARLELNSVGHVNHTAIYLSIMLGVCAAWLFIGRERIVASAATLLVLVSLFVAASRSGVVAGLLTLAVLALAWWPRSRFPAGLVAAVLVASGVLGVLGGAEVFEKHAESVQAGRTLNFREQAWTLAASSWQRHPWFGGGLDNFALASRELETQQLRDLMPHAHNLYLNTLAERGIVGALP